MALNPDDDNPNDASPNDDSEILYRRFEGCARHLRMNSMIYRRKVIPKIIARLGVAAGIAAAFATAATAHPKLVSAAPAATSVGPTTNTITLNFSDALVGQFSGMSILMTDMPGMVMTASMGVGTVTTTLGADDKTLVGRLKNPLPAGTYTLNWHVVSADTHRVEGKYSFKVE